MAFLPKVIKVGPLKVVLVKDDRESVMVQALVGTGAKEETDETAGSAHFLEHFVWKGTKQFPGMFDVSDAIDAVGGGRNAYTSYQEIGFWSRTAKEKLDLAVKVVGQLICEPLLPAKYFNKERGTILEELKMYEDQPDSKAFETMWELLYGNTNMGRRVLGTKKSLKSMTPEILSDYMNTWFVPENMLVGVVGNYESEKKVMELIEKEFGSIFEKKGTPEKNKFSWGESRVRTKLIKRKIEQGNLSIGMPGLPIGDPMRFTSNLVNIILGGGGLSRLFKEVREKRGWAYSVGSGSERFTDSGLVMIGAGVPKNKLKDATELILEIATGLGTKGKWTITKKDLDVARDCYKGRVSLSYDNPSRVLGNALSELMFENKIYSPDEVREGADKVTLEMVYEYCQKTFVREKMVAAVVGDYEKLPFEL